MRKELLSAHGLYAIACTIRTLPDSSDADRASGLTAPTPLAPALPDDTIDIRFPDILQYRTSSTPVGECVSEIRKAPASRIRQMSGCDASFIISLICNPILPPSGADGFPFPIVLTHANPFFHPFILPALETPETSPEGCMR